MQEMLPDIIEFSELYDFIDEPVRTYLWHEGEVGPRRRYAIEPDILLIDEVLGVGDPQFREKVKKNTRFSKAYKYSGYSFHSFALMREICDRIAVIHHGKLVMVDDPKEAILTYYDITAITHGKRQCRYASRNDIER